MDSAATVCVHCSFLELSEQRISTATLTAQNELRETFPVKFESSYSSTFPAAGPEWWLQPA